MKIRVDSLDRLGAGCRSRRPQSSGSQERNTHPASLLLPIAEIAAALGLKTDGRRARCFNAAAHESGEDAHPSLSFFPAANHFKCFACGVQGDAIDLVRRVLGADFKHAVAWIQARADGRSLASRPPSSQRAPARRPDEAVTKVLTGLFEMTYQIEPGSPAGKYLTGRAIDINVANQLYATEIQHADETWAELREQFDAKTLEHAGLMHQRHSFLFWGHTLLFWYFDDGWPVYVQARDVTGTAACKELSLKGVNCPVPYNADLLCEPHDCVYVAEGCIDTVSAIQMGLDAVGVPGAAGFQPDWFDRFKNVGRVVILFDNDATGMTQAAELRSQFRLRGMKADAYRPDGVKDVNEVLKYPKGEVLT